MRYLFLGRHRKKAFLKTSTAKNNRKKAFLEFNFENLECPRKFSNIVTRRQNKRPTSSKIHIRYNNLECEVILEIVFCAQWDAGCYQVVPSSKNKNPL